MEENKIYICLENGNVFEGKSSQTHLDNIYKFFEKGIVSQE